MSEEDDYDVLFIAIEYQGRSYMGAMGFESAYLLSPDLHCLTVAYRTFGFEEIGDIDLP